MMVGMKMMKVKISATSDLHGNLPEINQEFDLLLICGDICPSHNHNKLYQKEWLETCFCEWIKYITNQNNKVIIIPGNHDFYFENILEEKKRDLENKCLGKLKILYHEEYNEAFINENGEILLLKIFGTPYCSVFGNWAFMRSDAYLKEKFAEIPNDIDILISHDAPNIYGLGDITEGRYMKAGTGNKILADEIYRIKPRIFHCGHFHSGNHEFQEHEGIWMSNVSFVNEQYRPSNPILNYEYDLEKRIVYYRKDEN